MRERLIAIGIINTSVVHELSAQPGTSRVIHNIRKFQLTYFVLLYFVYTFK